MKHQKMQSLGLERIYRLFELAEEQLDKHPERSSRYVKLAREISKKVRARIPAELKLKFCKKCGSLLLGGKNAAISKNGAITIVKCLVCKFSRKSGNRT